MSTIKLTVECVPIGLLMSILRIVKKISRQKKVTKEAATCNLRPIRIEERLLWQNCREIHPNASFVKESVEQRLDTLMTSKQYAKYIFFPLLFLGLLSGIGFSQKIDLNNTLKPVIADVRMQYPALGKAPLFVNNFNIDLKKETLRIQLSKNFENIPYRKENVKALYDSIRTALPYPFNKYEIRIFIVNSPIEELIPNYFLEKKKRDKNRIPPVLPDGYPIVRNESKPYKATKGLTDKHLAIWHSHGWYYEQAENSWKWQRPRLFQTVEDIFTMGYTLPYLIPMLENAGANVFIPRERDTQANEVIVDNDAEKSDAYRETNGSKEKWEAGELPGFANPKAIYSELENPFLYGTYRKIKTEKKGDAAIEWIPDIPETGEYAVQIAYHTLFGSTQDAHYTVFHSGGKTEFQVNQTMGGGTWIYLGTFRFEKGVNPENGKVSLTNKSKENNKTLTADAVRFGGGFSNIGRTKIIDKVAEVQTSGKARYLEGARYWLQWAGFNDTVYNKNKNKDDYKDDYMSRGAWVNDLAGGSVKLPFMFGKNIPLDLAMGFHTDAGLFAGDSIYGTMAIYMTNTNNGLFKNEQRRIASRDLADLVQSEVIREIQTHFREDWKRRALTNQSYSEARIPEIPTLLLELLSHQNFADMRYGLDPNFRFSVSRAIYKGLLKFIATQYETDYAVQPLPVTHFSIEFMNEKEVYLSWNAQPDSLEPSAQPEKYIVYTSIENSGFDNGIIVEDLHAIIPIKPGKIYSFKVAAVNEGGESFPSEILSVCKMSNTSKTVLIINGFHRVSAPHFFDNGLYAGFLDKIDPGVPDKYDVSYTGNQYLFDRSILFKTNEEPGFGASLRNHENDIIAGNTFNYPYAHGKAIRNAGYSFVSCSDEIITPENADLKKYFAVDLILGQERETETGKGKRYKIFKEPVRKVLTDYLESGGNLFASGSYIGSDIWMHEECDPKEIRFAEHVLHYRWQQDAASTSGKAVNRFNYFPLFKTDYTFCTSFNRNQYAVKSPDAIEPANGSFRILSYEDTQLPACVAYKGKYSTVIAGFPFESIETEGERSTFMKEILDFFEQEKENEKERASINNANKKKTRKNEKRKTRRKTKMLISHITPPNEK